LQATQNFHRKTVYCRACRVCYAMFTKVIVGLYDGPFQYIFHSVRVCVCIGYVVTEHEGIYEYETILLLTICRSYLNHYCIGRKTAFFQRAFKFTYCTINRSAP